MKRHIADLTLEEIHDIDEEMNTLLDRLQDHGEINERLYFMDMVRLTQIFVKLCRERNVDIMEEDIPL